jgi:hypothetical protein
MLIRYMGTAPATIRGIGDVKQGDVRDVPESLALSLIAQDDWKRDDSEPEKPTPAKEG